MRYLVRQPKLSFETCLVVLSLGQRTVVRLASLAASIVLITEKQGGHARSCNLSMRVFAMNSRNIVHYKEYLSIRIGGAEIAA